MPAAESRVLHGDCVHVMQGLAADSVDAVICDPPYGIGPSGHEWEQEGFRGRADGTPASGRFGRSAAVVAGRYDRSLHGNRLFQAWCETWACEALRVLKPGGYMLAFGAPTTSHRLACGIEDAGFEKRGEIIWLFGEGWPKGKNIAMAFDRAAGIDVKRKDWQPTSPEAKAWTGWHTGLKPGHETIVIARKPLAVRSVTRNITLHGTGAMNVDAVRVPLDAGDDLHVIARNADGGLLYTPHSGGRFPADVILDPAAADELNGQSGVLRSGANPTRRNSPKFQGVYGAFDGQLECEPARGVDIGGAARFYYCSRAAADERDAGCEQWGGNPHPTPKPISLLRWLVRLITPERGVVLDMFGGSGTTGCAAVLEQRGFIGIDREPCAPAYRPWVHVMRARIGYWEQHPEGPAYQPRPRPLDEQAPLFSDVAAAAS